jgi:hypothetical protein
MNITKQKEKLLLNLEKDKIQLKSESDNTNILMQRKLQNIMLGYLVDIEHKLELVDNDLASNYPTELISSLKIITDLYLKMKEENKRIKIVNEDKPYYVSSITRDNRNNHHYQILFYQIKIPLACQ